VNTCLDGFFQRQNVGSPAGQPTTTCLTNLVADNAVKKRLLGILSMLAIDGLGIASWPRSTRDIAVSGQVWGAAPKRANFDQVIIFVFLLRRNLIDFGGFIER
jgi:hypothetical protein